MSVMASRSEPTAFKEAAAAYIDQLYRVASHLTRQKGDADDLVQETYLRAISNASQFKPGTNLRAWLAKILYNVFVNRYHRQRKTVSLDQPRSESENSWLDTLTSDKPGPELQILQSELKEKLKEAVESLSEDFATPIILVDVGGFSYSEVAEIISCPVGTIRSRLFRARAILAAKLREYVRHEK